MRTESTLFQCTVSTNWGTGPSGGEQNMQRSVQFGNRENKKKIGYNFGNVSK